MLNMDEADVTLFLKVMALGSGAAVTMGGGLEEQTSIRWHQ